MLYCKKCGVALVEWPDGSLTHTFSGTDCEQVDVES